MYFSMVDLHLDYMLLALGFDSDRVMKLPKRCVRTITTSKYHAVTYYLNSKPVVCDNPVCPLIIRHLAALRWIASRGLRFYLELLLV